MWKTNRGVTLDSEYVFHGLYAYEYPSYICNHAENPHAHWFEAEGASKNSYYIDFVFLPSHENVGLRHLVRLIQTVYEKDKLHCGDKKATKLKKDRLKYFKRVRSCFG